MRGDSLGEFLSQLPRLWQAGEVRPTHRNAPAKPRDWRTRKDPFDSVWAEVLQWLEREPVVTGKALFERLKQEHPDRFQDGQLRTLQRRVKDWRHIMAKKLVFGCIGEQSDGTTDRSIRGE